MARFFADRPEVGNEFLVNQFTSYNQRTPAVAALTDGGFVVAWVSEQQRAPAPVLGTNTTYSRGQLRRCFRVWTFMRGFTTATVSPAAVNFS